MVELLYSISSALIAAIAFLMMLLFLYGGYRLGLKRQSLYNEPLKAQVIAVQGSLLGLLSLLLGFTFAIAVHHFDKRSEAMKEEANAIGTTYLRAHSLPDAVRDETLAILKEYVDIRVLATKFSVVESIHRDPLLEKADQLRTNLWNLAMRSVKDDDRVTTTGLYIQALNNLIDSFGTRDEALNRHIPEIIIFLVIFAMTISSFSIGYTSAISNHRPSAIAIGFMIFIIILTTVLLDLDRPRRGFIQIGQKNMLDLQKEIGNSQRISFHPERGSADK